MSGGQWDGVIEYNPSVISQVCQVFPWEDLAYALRLQESTIRRLKANDDRMEMMLKAWKDEGSYKWKDLYEAACDINPQLAKVIPVSLDVLNLKQDSVPVQGIEYVGETRDTRLYVMPQQKEKEMEFEEAYFAVQKDYKEADKDLPKQGIYGEGEEMSIEKDSIQKQVEYEKAVLAGEDVQYECCKKGDEADDDI